MERLIDDFKTAAKIIKHSLNDYAATGKISRYKIMRAYDMLCNLKWLAYQFQHTEEKYIHLLNLHENVADLETARMDLPFACAKSRQPGNEASAFQQFTDFFAF